MVRIGEWLPADNKQRLKIFVQVSDFGLRSIEPLFLISKPVAWGLTSCQIERNYRSPDEVNRFLQLFEDGRAEPAARHEWFDEHYRKNYPWDPAKRYKVIDRHLGMIAVVRDTLHGPEQGRELARAILDYDARIRETNPEAPRTLSEEIGDYFVGGSRLCRLPRSTKAKAERNSHHLNQGLRRAVQEELLRDILNAYIAAQEAGCNAILLPKGDPFLQDLFDRVIHHPVVQGMLCCEEGSHTSQGSQAGASTGSTTSAREQKSEEGQASSQQSIQGKLAQPTSDFVPANPEVLSYLCGLVDKILKTNANLTKAQEEIETCAQILWEYGLRPIGADFFRYLEAIDEMEQRVKEHVWTVGTVILLIVHIIYYSENNLPGLSEFVKILYRAKRLMELFKDGVQMRRIRSKFPTMPNFYRLVKVYQHELPKQREQTERNPSVQEPVLLLRKR
jgi:hypothetical protein